jgi:hypothetical protein
MTLVKGSAGRLLRCPRRRRRSPFGWMETSLAGFAAKWSAREAETNQTLINEALRQHIHRSDESF